MSSSLKSFSENVRLYKTACYYMYFLVKKINKKSHFFISRKALTNICDTNSSFDQFIIRLFKYYKTENMQGQVELK